MTTPQCLLPAGTQHGAAPCWQAATGQLWFVDISGQRLHRCAADGGDHRSWPAPGPVSFALPLVGGGLVVGAPGGLLRFTDSGRFSTLLPVELREPANRPNDAHVDAQGRLWFGTLHMPQTKPSGVLYSMSADRGLQRQDEGYTVSNGPATSPDGRTLYHTDSTRQRVYAFDLSDDGRLSRKRELLRLDDGHPDGTTVDAEGHLWIGVWGGWRVDRYTPEGRRVDSIRLPCQHVTKLAFGGADLRTAYVATARFGLTPQQLLEQPLVGGVFSFRVDTPGLPQHAALLLHRQQLPLR